MADESITKLEQATLAGGCFWCIQHPFELLDGVKKVIAGYANGNGENPTYKNYAEKGFVEAVQITYDPKIISFDKILNVFWRQFDPTDAGGQFYDRGPHYRAAIFFHTPEQKEIAEKSKQALNKSGRFSKPIVTEVAAFSNFFPAEGYHQDYYKANPLEYKSYRSGSGRDNFIDAHWSKENNDIAKEVEGNPMTTFKKPSDEELKKKLTPIQYVVTQKNGTEKPFSNAYVDNKEAGIYVDVVSGEVLFSSLDKFDSGTGWPSFTKPLVPENIVEKVDKELFTPRTEIRSKNADSHVGHVFNDGPQPTGLRYCMNSAALRFIPVSDLEKEGYGQYKKLFED